MKILKQLYCLIFSPEFARILSHTHNQWLKLIRRVNAASQFSLALVFKIGITVIKSIYEIFTAKKYNHYDPDIGQLKRVGSYWRVESPKKTLAVSVKLHGSDRFGPNRKSLAAYKLRRNQIESIWAHSIQCIIDETRNDDGSSKFSENEFVLTEIIFGPPNKDGAEFAYAFNITSAPNEYGACIHGGKYKHYYTLY